MLVLTVGWMVLVLEQSLCSIKFCVTRRVRLVVKILPSSCAMAYRVRVICFYSYTFWGLEIQNAFCSIFFSISGWGRLIDHRKGRRFQSSLVINDGLILSERVCVSVVYLLW